MKHCRKHHRKYHIDLEEDIEYVTHDVHKEHSHVTYVLNSIKSNDPDVLVTVVNIYQDDHGKHQNFKKMVVSLFQPI